MAHEFSWSVSRHDTFNSCRRKYFYSYYLAPDDPEIHRLKKLSALPLWAGSVVHEIIEGILKTRDTMPSETEQQAIVHAAVHGASSAIGASRGGPRAKTACCASAFSSTNTPPPSTRKTRRSWSHVMRSLRNFFRSPVLQEALAVGRSQWLTVEDLVSFDVGGVPVFLRMDLAFRDAQGRVVIVDWKTGRGEGRFNEIQLAGYALYAARQGWVTPAEEIQTELAYLAIPRYVRRSVDARKLDHARAFIEKSAERMKALLVDPALNLGRIEDFAMIDRPQLCRRCNFRRLCFPPAAVAAAEAPQPSAAI